MFASLVATSLLFAATPLDPASIRLRTPEGHARLIQGTLTSPIAGDLVEGARAFAESQRGTLGMPTSSRLGEATVFGTRLGGAVHFPQQVGELAVDGARVVVTLNPRREIVGVTSSLVSYERAQVAWNVDVDEALAIAAHAINGALLKPEGGAYGAWKRLMFPVENVVRAGYLVFVPTLVPNENWYVAVDASSGAVLWTENRVKYVKAEVYGPTSLYSPGVEGIGSALLDEVELTNLDPARAPGPLVGERITVFNCCVNENCDPSGAPRRVQGTYNFNGTPVPYDSVVCDRLQRASDDPEVHPSGDFVYTPVDPPTHTQVVQTDPANSDEFVEVNAFWHVNLAYDFVRGLSDGAHDLFPDDPRFSTFEMRDTRAGRKPYVWTNLVVPDIYAGQLQRTRTGFTYKIDKLARQDNAAFMPRENFEGSPLPDYYKLDADTLLIFQGNAADFGYDAPVLWHEFGHGVIYSTADFRAFIVDSRSANNEGGALHEGIADYIAGALGQISRIGAYVGPRLGQGLGLRDMNNSYSCPTVLIGEVHHDSQHFSAALWETRQHFLGSDEGRSFDAAVYAALVSMTPATGFEEAGEILIDTIARAFPTTATARATAQGVFDARGVTNCSKVFEQGQDGKIADQWIIGSRVSAQLGATSQVPGPYQIKRALPQGASSVTVKAHAQANTQGDDPTFTLLTRSGSPITFTRAGGKLDHDADQVAVSTNAVPAVATVELDIPCGGELYLALGNAMTTELYLQNFTVTVEPRGTCVDPEIQQPEARKVPLVPADLGKKPAGCSAPGVVGAELLGLVLLTLFARRRRE